MSGTSGSVPRPTAVSTTSLTSTGASSGSLPTLVAFEAGPASPSSSPCRSINGTSLGLEHGDANVDASGESDPEADDVNSVPASAPSNRLTASTKLHLGGGSGFVLAHLTRNERGSTGERSPSPAPQNKYAIVVESTPLAPAVTACAATSTRRSVACTNVSTNAPTLARRCAAPRLAHSPRHTPSSRRLPPASTSAPIVPCRVPCTLSGHAFSAAHLMLLVYSPAHRTPITTPRTCPTTTISATGSVSCVAVLSTCWVRTMKPAGSPADTFCFRSSGARAKRAMPVSVPRG